MIDDHHDNDDNDNDNDNDTDNDDNYGIIPELLQSDHHSSHLHPHSFFSLHEVEMPLASVINTHQKYIICKYFAIQFIMM